MFWRKAAPSESAQQQPKLAAVPEPRESRPSEAPGEAALEAVGSMLRILSEFPFDLPDTPASQISKTFDRWSKHLLVGGPHPNLHRDARENEYQTPNRDWPGLAQFFRAHRKKESEHVTRSLTELRTLIWTFVDRMARNLPAEERFETETKGQMDRLKHAVERNAIEDIKREALTTVAFLEKAIKERNDSRRSEIENLSNRVTALREQLDDARKKSEIDALTQLANRRAFDLQIERAALMTMLCRQENSLILVDIDHFKKINDTYGHPGGDAVLKELASRMLRSFPRKMDCVARFGGEEFAILLRESSGVDAKRLAERFLTEVRALNIQHGPQTIRITASAGVAQNKVGEEPSEWIARVDSALYKAKHGGRDRVEAA